MASALPQREFSALVGRIYDCAIEPDRWPAILEELGRLVDGLGSSLMVLDPVARKLRFSVAQGVDPFERRHFEENHAADETNQMLLSLMDERIDLNEPLVYRRMMSEEVLQRSALYQDWSQRLGVINSIATIALRDKDRLGIWTAVRHRDAGLISDREVDLMRDIAPHLRRAVTISDILDSRRIEATAFGATLDMLSAAVVIVGKDGRVIHANAMAEPMLSASSPIASKDGRLTASTSEAAVLLGEALSRAMRGNDDTIGVHGIGVPLSTADGRHAAAYVLPLAMGDLRTRLMPQALAAVFITASGGRPRGIDTLAALYGLTPMEARVTELLAAGRSVGKTAEELGNAEATVRTHLARIFSKTGTTRQGELVALVVRLLPPVSRE